MAVTESLCLVYLKQPIYLAGDQGITILYCYIQEDVESPVRGVGRFVSTSNNLYILGSDTSTRLSISIDNISAVLYEVSAGALATLVASLANKEGFVDLTTA